MRLPAILIWAALGQMIPLLGLVWVLPRVARRDFLFGVFVGVERKRLQSTRTVFRIWDAGLLMILLLAAAACAGLWWTGWRLGALCLPPVGILFCGIALYLHCHNRSRHFGVRGPSIAVAPVRETALVREAVPLAFQVLPWVLGLAVLIWTLLKWRDIPPRVPAFWDEEGGPVAWSDKSVFQVFAGPVLAFVTLLVPLHLASIMIARTKMPLRDPGPPSVRRRSSLYRKAFVWYLWTLSMLMAGVVVFMQWDGVRSMLGAGRLGREPAVVALSVTLAGLLGAVLLAARVAHGLGRGEKEEAEEMRDFIYNSRWVAGLFYFNPEDPAFLIHQRYGVGFTVNFGNRSALAIATGLLVLALLLALGPLLFLILRA